MKKLLILTGILALSAVAFGANSESTAEVPVKAEVIKPLNVTKVQDLDFGVLFPGETKTADTAKEGKINVDGNKNTNIKIEMSADSSYSNSILNNLVVPLSATSGATMDATVSLKREDGLSVSNDEVFNLGETGILNFNIGGSVVAATNQEVGSYEGTIHVKAKYDNLGK